MAKPRGAPHSRRHKARHTPWLAHGRSRAGRRTIRLPFTGQVVGRKAQTSSSSDRCRNRSLSWNGRRSAARIAAYRPRNSRRWFPRARRLRRAAGNRTALGGSRSRLPTSRVRARRRPRSLRDERFDSCVRRIAPVSGPAAIRAYRKYWSQTRQVQLHPDEQSPW